MGKLKSGVFGGFSGKVGNLIGSSWKGISVVKMMPESVANPKTNAQVAQRTAFAACVMVASSILSTIVKPLWDRFSVQASGYNDFVSANIANFDSTGIADLPNILISKGKMAVTNIASAIADKSLKTIVVTFGAKPSDAYAQDTDLAYIVVAPGMENPMYGYDTQVTRSAGSATVALPDVCVVGQFITVYLAFKRNDGTVVSNSVNVEVGVIA